MARKPRISPELTESDIAFINNELIAMGPGIKEDGGKKK